MNWISVSCFAQATITLEKHKIDSLNMRLDDLTKKSVRAGISLAYRSVNKKFDDIYQSASISPVDSTLQFETLDKNAFVLSTSVVISPFIKTDWIERLSKESRAFVKDTENQNGKRFAKGLGVVGLYLLQNIGLTANINLLEFANAEKGSTFNKSLEGGIGFCLRLSEKIYVSYASDVLFTKQLRQDIKEQEGNKIYKDGNVVTSIDQIDTGDSNYWITKNVIGRNARVIILF